MCCKKKAKSKTHNARVLTREAATSAFLPLPPLSRMVRADMTTKARTEVSSMVSHVSGAVATQVSDTSVASSVTHPRRKKGKVRPHFCRHTGFRPMQPSHTDRIRESQTAVASHARVGSRGALATHLVCCA